MTQNDQNPAFAAVAAAITERRTVKQFSSQPVPPDVIEQLIDLAVWAPNHRLNEPWRFYVLTGNACARLGEIAGAITAAKISAVGGEASVAARKGSEAAATWGSVPTLIFMTMMGDANPEVDLENYGAVCCAIQNFTLAAHVAGIGTSWSSGAVAASPDLLTLVGAGTNERMVGLIRVGYFNPAASPATSRRKPGISFTRWVEE